jgi:hypothetical protein
MRKKRAAVSHKMFLLSTSVRKVADEIPFILAPIVVRSAYGFRRIVNSIRSDTPKPASRQPAESP